MQKYCYILMFTLFASINIALSTPTIPAKVTVELSNTLQNTPVISFPFLQKEPHTLNEVDFDKFVDLALSEQLTVSQAATFIQKLNKYQLETISSVIAKRKPLNKNSFIQTIKNPLKNLEDRKYRNKSFLGTIRTPLSQPLLAFHSGRWDEWMENTWVRWHPSSYAYPSYWSKSQYTCDSKSDSDFVFHFNYGFNNKKRLRWTTDSTAVYTVLMSVYQGKLSSYGYDHEQVKMCVGNKAVFWAGGADRIFKTIYIHSK